MLLFLPTILKSTVHFKSSIVLGVSDSLLFQPIEAED